MVDYVFQMDEYVDILKIRIIGIATLEDENGDTIYLLNSNKRTMFKKDYYIFENKKYDALEEDDVILGLRDDPEGKYDEPDINYAELQQYVDRVIAGEDSNAVADDIDRQRKEAIEKGERPFKYPRDENNEMIDPTAPTPEEIAAQKALYEEDIPPENNNFWDK